MSIEVIATVSVIANLVFLWLASVVEAKLKAFKVELDEKTQIINDARKQVLQMISSSDPTTEDMLFHIATQIRGNCGYELNILDVKEFVESQTLSSECALNLVRDAYYFEAVMDSLVSTYRQFRELTDMDTDEMDGGSFDVRY